MVDWKKRMKLAAILGFIGFCVVLIAQSTIAPFNSNQTPSTAGILVGRRSTSAGSLEEISVGSGLSLSGTTLTASGASLPAGIIVMWAGTTNTIPSGWALCDGTVGTPDLTDRFIRSVAVGEQPGGTGGSLSVTSGSTSGGTPAGTVSAPTFTGNALGTHAHGVGSYDNTATSAGTPAGTVSAPTFTGNALGTHTHTFTGNAVNAASTAATPDLVTSNTGGTGVSPTTTATGTNSSVSAGTPSGTVSAPTFTGSALATHDHTFSGTSESISAGTPAGTVSAPTFTGSALATHTHSVATEPTYYKLAFIQKL